ncbi:cytochrome-c peroxidase [Sinorhizobium mexicanum]|uniref:Methylamine utilization protein n=1 Tax=Sinorhizobium mexicanum TaxID=375549 RepID=A0A859QT74_9HYPH|nr:cytochrome c peroxidase [Sinorhizobium mexicanum]MBP1885799.1 cytochrome c peroxidase [Sinorhizobium mexicanum]QLL60468.1 methylamine utilization protein [Sinorhizobium mexicanum]
MKRSGIFYAAAGIIALVVLAGFSYKERIFANQNWSEEQKSLIASLLLDALPALPADPSNRVANDPRAAELGQALFNDKRLSANAKVACATCHLRDRQFQDGTPLGHGVGQTNRRTMPISGTAHAPFLFWDGRKDSQWAQALGPLESAVEHGSDRTALARRLAVDYRRDYERLFGPLPEFTGLPDHASPEGNAAAKAAWSKMTEGEREAINRVFANIGKAIAAFERTIKPRETRFDRYARSLQAGTAPNDQLSEPEIAGLALFIGKGNCINCHNGPLLTDNHFHNTGVPAVEGLPEDTGRALGALQVKNDPFNCRGRYSDAAPSDCTELNFMVSEGDELLRAYKPPSLRNVALRPPYMHAGQFRSLDEVVRHYNKAPPAPAGHSELEPLKLNDREVHALQAFLATLSEED